MSTPTKLESGLDEKINFAPEPVVSEVSEVDPDYNGLYSDDHVNLHRKLSARQVNMIAIAGTIGTGLFLGSGRAVVRGGAVGAVLGYTLVGGMIWMMMMCLGEMSVHTPDSGNFVGFAGRYVDPALGFALGWIYAFYAAILVPVEIVAAGIVLQYWDENVKHLSAFIVAMIVAIVLANAFGSKYFGEIEFWFGALKVTTILGLIILGLVIDLGGAPSHDRIGFRYWKLYPLNDTYGGISSVSTARFLGFWAVLTQASFSFGGVESLAVIVRSDVKV